MSTFSDISTPAIILVAPQMGENIGAAARVMRNFGLTDLRIVAPRDGWPNESALRSGAGAFDAITPRIGATLAEVAGDLHTLYATTARRRDMEKPLVSPAQAMKGLTGQTGFLFGRERTGLENPDIALAQAIVEIPTNPAFSSLNLAHAVAVMAYQWQLTRENACVVEINHRPAAFAQTQELMTRLEGELAQRGFFKSPDLKPKTINNINALLARAHMSDQEVRTFHGMISALIGNKNCDQSE